MIIDKHNCFYEILPWPESISLAEGSFDLNQPIAIITEPKHGFQAKRLAKGFEYLGIVQGDGEHVVCMKEDKSIASPEGWRITVEPEKVTLCASGNAGMSYAVASLLQMMSVATMAGEGRFLEMQCGMAESTPRFQWRGFMMDSARHFASKETIVKMLYTMAHYRYNVFHWHLTDNEGWRTPSRICPELAGKGELTDGMYSYDDIAEIRALAKTLDIKIVPEIDLPGHSRRLVHLISETGCSSGAADEICVGSQKAREIVGRLLDEFMGLFPESTEIHLGGDEAEKAHWEKCPECQAAMKAKGFTDLRQLEHDFMLYLVERVQKTGRKAIVWNDSGVFPKDVIVQLWVEKNRVETLENGNPVINSSCSSCYTSRLLPWDLKFTDFQHPTLIEDNYMFEPMMGAHEYEKQFLGIEVCAWSGFMPERRIWAKVMPRLVALSEVAFGDPRQKFWGNFKMRYDRQRDAALEQVW